MPTSQFMLAITDFTNKRFSTNRVHKMFHKTTISLHSLLLHWITILLLTDIAVFVFNAATAFIFFPGDSEKHGGSGRWRGPIACSLHWMAWPWCNTWHFNRDGDAPWKKKIIKMVGSYPALKPSPSVLQKALQQPTEQHKDLRDRNRVHEIRRQVRLESFV